MEEQTPADRLMDVGLTLLLLAILVPATLLTSALVYVTRPREEEIVVEVSGFVVVRE
jgi:hypothetical protein